ncbi:MAG TPA: nucleotide exchange factor GrpE [Candidatus Woesebacteria bacterium]|nr:nucleotide exchange factor GrpE [Candidatus Shapirobacteria bacterium]HNY04131.1 nucleotide exchange factor GrpE [Candidatus Woesebacteria bacterium]HOY61038.1 nucleotide exchange factor GrpE [Candidatus Woesebacteria bacterium]HPR99744.1 nucleotide exchange factor GrpE [Candidatus Woesebacteria bacterium]
MTSKKTKNKTNLVPEILKLENQIKELEDKLTRSLADYSNLQKRQEEQHQFFATLAISAFISQILSVLDDLYLAQANLKNPGLQMAINNFETVLKNQGLQEIEALNKEFVPDIMECLQTKKGETNKVLEVKKRGYLLNGHCLRPAQVVVGKKL